MRLTEALALPERGRLSIVGGGGKSTLMERLALELAEAGRRVAVTTTTHISAAQGAAFRAGPADCLAVPSPEPGKLGPPPAWELAAALTAYDGVLAEADGARGLPVKAPADHEPVLLDGGLVAAVAGLSALGRPLAEVCHRPRLAAEVLGAALDTALTPSLLARLLTSERGQFKGVGDAGRFRVVLNQADGGPRLALGRETAREIQIRLPGCRVVLTALRQADCVKEVLF